jgi:signal transduction histidine kinase
MGGEALVRSTPGVGSTFSLVLPSGAPASRRRSAQASPRLP